MSNVFSGIADATGFGGSNAKPGPNRSRPASLDELDNELKSLGYTGGPPPVNKPAANGVAIDTGAAASNDRINTLLGMRQSFLDEQAKLNAKAPKGRAATSLTSPQGVLSTANLASRTLLA